MCDPRSKQHRLLRTMLNAIFVCHPLLTFPVVGCCPILRAGVVRRHRSPPSPLVSAAAVLVNKLSRNGNGYHLYLKNTYKSTNQRRNSIQNAPTRTKLGKPKTDPTMVILVAFYILLMHICSALCLMPRDHFWRSNAFSPCQELPISGQHKSDFSSAGCWHIHNQINTTTKRQHIPKKHIHKSPSSSHSQSQRRMAAMFTRRAPRSEE
jgi:hypothetical protein